MPFVRVKTNRTFEPSAELELKTRIGEAISLIPGKSEDFLLLTFEDDMHIWWHGSNEHPVVYIEASAFATEDRKGYPEFTEAVTQAFSEVLQMPAENVYIQFSDIPGWSVGGNYIDRSSR